MSVSSVVFLAAIVRLVVLVIMFGQFRSDPDAYREIASNVLRHGSFALDLPEAADGEAVAESYKPTAYRPPLYPLLLAAMNVGSDSVSSLHVALLHWFLGVATAALTFVTGRAMGMGKGASRAAIVVMLDPILLNQSTLIMTETLAAFLAIFALFYLQRFAAEPAVGRALTVGGILGLAALCRPTFLPWLALVILLVLLCRRLDPTAVTTLPQRLKFAALIATASLLVMSPWIARNQFVFGKPIVTTTHGGYTLLLGNNPAYYEYLASAPHPAPWPADDPEFQAMLPKPPPPTANELEYDAATKQLAFESIQRDPGMFVYSSLHRIGQLWATTPNPTTAKESLARQALRQCVRGWYWGMYFLLAVGVYQLRDRLLEFTWLAALLLCLSLTLMHSVYWSNLRMRAPLIPVVALLIGAGGVVLESRQKLPVHANAEQGGTG